MPEQHENNNDSRKALRDISATINAMNSLNSSLQSVVFRCNKISEALPNVHKDDFHEGVIYRSVMEILYYASLSYAFTKYKISSNALKLEVYRDSDFTDLAGNVIFSIHTIDNDEDDEDEDESSDNSDN